MWTRFYSPFWYENEKKNTKWGKKESCAFQCKFSPFWLLFEL